MFNKGDTVEIVESSYDTGMMDFVLGKGYEVLAAGTITVCVADESGKVGWYHSTHFKLKENTGADAVLEFGVGDTVICIETDFYELDVNDITYLKEYVVKRSNRGCIQIVKDSGELGWFNGDKFKLKEDIKVEKKEYLFKVGQTVWDVAYGKGEVVRVGEGVHVKFKSDNTTYTFTANGSYDDESVRTLFFSEPKIEAATEPVFEPTLKEGDVVIAIDATATSFPSHVFTVIEENVNFVKTEEFGVMGKERWDFYRLGEKINFK